MIAWGGGEAVKAALAPCDVYDWLKEIALGIRFVEDVVVDVLHSVAQSYEDDDGPL
jgi:hypothetical protein